MKINIKSNFESGSKEETNSIERNTECNDQESVCETEDKICTLHTTAAAVKNPKKYKMKEDFGINVLKALAGGRHSCGSLAKKLNVGKTRIAHWRNKGLALGIIIHDGGISPAFYAKGPRYYLLKSPGWQSQKFGPVECRVHAPYGDYFQYLAVVIGELHQLQVRADDGSIHFVKLFPRQFKKNTRIKYPSTHFEVPRPIVNYDGAEATLKLGSKSGSDVLFISPPAIFQTLQEFERIENPFKLALRYVVDFLEHRGKWSLVELTPNLSFHYAFEWGVVKLYCPDLLLGIPHLGKAANPADIVLYWDESLGKGIRDYETTSRGIANDLFALLEVNRKQIIGKRKAKYRKARKMSNKGLVSRKFPLGLAVEDYLGAGPTD